LEDIGRFFPLHKPTLALLHDCPSELSVEPFSPCHFLSPFFFRDVLLNRYHSPCGLGHPTSIAFLSGSLFFSH
jgi:hypothetical protein